MLRCDSRSFLLLAFLLAAMLALASCSQAPETSKEPVKTYPMRGEVMRLDPQHKIATIKHENIEGWMEAMTMDFPVREQVDFDKLKPGQQIKATVQVQGMDYWIRGVEVVAPGSSAPHP